MSVAPYFDIPYAVTDPWFPASVASDPILDSNFQFLYDFTRLASYPTAGDPVNGTQVINMVPGKPNGSIVKDSGSNITYVDSGLKLNGVEGNHIELGGINDFKLSSLSNPDVLWYAYFKRLTPTQGAYASVLGRGTTNTGNQEFSISTASDGASIYCRVEMASGTQAIAIPAGAAQTAYNALYGTTVLAGFAIEGGKMKLFVNQNQVNESAAGAIVKPYNAVSALPVKMGYGAGGVPFQGIVKRAGMTVLTSGRTAASIIAQEWAANGSRLNS